MINASFHDVTLQQNSVKRRQTEALKNAISQVKWVTRVQMLMLAAMTVKSTYSLPNFN